ncbi:MAG: D-glycero-beta-D-manno-heptose 1-phosphate adenylyltransferase [Candidatus Omnitrophica bacterium]|nr:D-glycero-beta-D-manno-heptose 1-phosphate adenylyltransferase [Candidatus Omnitrophota bacterium]
MFDRKLKSGRALAAIVRRLQRSGKKVVFTNGCFDLMHYGHAKYMEEAKSHGDVLVVAVNSDASVRRLKGRGRPIVKALYRAKLVASLESVDYVVIFGEDTPLSLIRRLKPDVLVKGADWAAGEIAGAGFVKRRGGKIVRVKLVKGLSTTQLIKRIAHA